jgi:hypothetical protein
MIIKSIRVRTRSGIGRLVRHLRNGADNDAVEFLQGTARDIQDMQADACVHSSTYSVRHWIIAPQEVTTREQFRKTMVFLATQFGFDPNHAVIIEHTKKRATASATDRHWHVLVCEIDAVTGKTLRSSFDRILHELTARWSEYSFGHSFIPGKHTAAVIRGLRNRGMASIADRLTAELGTSVELPAEAFSHAQHQQAKREGFDLVSVKLTIQKLVAEAANAAEFEAGIRQHGLEIRAGDKKNTWVVASPDGSVLGALHRLAAERKSAINVLMEKVNEQRHPNRTGHSEGHQSYPPPPGSGRGGERNRTSDLASGKNAGSHRADPSADRADAPTPEQRQAKPHTQSTRLALTIEQGLLVQRLHAKACELAKPNLSRVSDELSRLEVSARADLAFMLPKRRYTPEVIAAKADTERARAAVDSAFDRQWQLAESIRNAPKVSWWTYLIGLAGVRSRRIEELQRQLASADDHLWQCRTYAGQCEAQQVKAERLAEQQHRTAAGAAAARHQAANDTLLRVARARAFLVSFPETAEAGLDYVLRRSTAGFDDDAIRSMPAFVPRPSR